MGEHPPGLVSLVGAAEQDDLGILLDELDPAGEIVPHRLHRQGEHALSLEQPGGRNPHVAQPRSASSAPNLARRQRSVVLVPLSGALYWLADLWDSLSEDDRADTIRYIGYIVHHRHD